MAKEISRFYEMYLAISGKNPDKTLAECYEMAEKWHKWRFGQRKYKNLYVFKSTYSRKLNKNKVK